jgi:uncharacterized delta-60 repeat protein
VLAGSKRQLYTASVNRRVMGLPFSHFSETISLKSLLRGMPTRLNRSLAILMLVSVTLSGLPTIGLSQNQYPAPNLITPSYTTGYYARHTSPLLVGQCTWYAYGRIQEVGVISSATLSSKGFFHGNAPTWPSDAVNAGFSVGSQPQQGAIAVWTSGRGHVAFVEQVNNGTPLFTESNATPMNGWNVVICRDDQDAGGWKVKLRSSASIPASGDNTVGYLPKFNVFSVVDGPTPGSGYYWYHLSASGYDGWAAFLEIDTGTAANPSDPNRDFSWGFTRIKLQPSSSSIAMSGSPDQYIYLTPTLGPPNINSPGDLSAPGPVLADLAPTFTWSAVVGATGYGLYIRDMTATGNPLVYPNAGGTTTTPLTGTSFSVPGGYLVTGHAYKWNMSSFIGSTESTTFSAPRFFQAPTVAVPPPAINSPGDLSAPGPVLGDLAPTFSWSAVAGATGYGLYIRDMTASGNPLVYPNAGGTTTTPLTGTSFSLSSGYLVTGHAYKWNMSSFIGSTESTAFSAPRYFQASTVAVPPPAINSPGDLNAPGPVLADLAPTFSWSAVAGATGYGLYIRDMTANGTLVYPNANGTPTPPLTGTSFSVPSGYLVTGHAYKWNMSSFVGSTESTTFSTPRYFQAPTLPVVAPAGSIQVLATLDGVPWSGPVRYSLISQTMMFSIGGISVPALINNAPPSIYKMSVSDGPSDTLLSNFNLFFNQELGANGSISFTLNFISKASLPSGPLDASFAPKLARSAVLTSVVIQPDAKVIAAGDFDHVNGSLRSAIVRLNPDGTVDESFQCPNIEREWDTDDRSSTRVRALMLQPDGKIVVGGQFSRVAGVQITNLVRLLPDGGLDASFRPLADPHWSHVQDGVQSLAGLGDGSFLASWGSPGTIAGSYAVSTNGSVYASLYGTVTVQPDGKLLVGQWLGTTNPVLTRLTKLAPDHYSVDPTFRSELTVSQSTYSGGAAAITAIAVQAAGQIVVAGSFDTVNGVPHGPVVRLNSSGEFDAAFNPEMETGAIVQSLALGPDDSIFVTGKFTRIEGAKAPYNCQADARRAPGCGFQHWKWDPSKTSTGSHGYCGWDSCVGRRQ